jgi:LPS O-antigen subunit length determinant protein (WzzB/FepE family)
MSQNRSNSNQNDVFQDELEISLLDILRFLKGAFKIILVFGLLGIAIAIAYLVITPQQYEASAKIAMAQIGVANNNNNLSPLGVNIEEPALLISRLAQPTSFTQESILACGFEGKLEAGATLANAIKFSLPKGVVNMVELKTIGDSPQLSTQCAGAIFELIKSTQNQIITPYIEEAKQKLVEEKVRLQAAQDLVSRSDKSGSVMGAAYLSTRDEVKYLLDSIAALNNVVTNNQNRATRLIAPIYASNVPIGPKKVMARVVGFFGGLFLGLLIAVARQIMARSKGQMGEAL